jgi:hypothetical protein
MDMKRILQALDGVAEKPKASAGDMSRFLSIVNTAEKAPVEQVLNEGKNPHKVTLPVQMAMQHYQQSTEAVVQSPSLLKQYVDQVVDKHEEEQAIREQRVRMYSQKIANRVLMKEAANPAQQAAIAIAKKKKKGMKESGYNHGHADSRAPQLGADEKREFKRAELQHELGDESNNIAIAINGKTWKVVPGRGYADSREEREYLHHMQRWAEKKSASSGKEWSVHLTGANPTNESISEGPLDFDKENPSASRIYGHKSNPGSIEYRIMRARAQLKDMAERANSNELLVWESITKHFPELAMNIEEIRHGIEELAKIRKGGGRRVHNIPKEIGETNTIKEANKKKRTLKNSNPCWTGYHPVGTKQKGGRTVPNCVPKE